MPLPDGGEVDERRAQHERGGRVLGGQLGDDGGAEALAVEDDPVRRHARLGDEEPVGGRTSSASPCSDGLPGLPP